MRLHVYVYLSPTLTIAGIYIKLKEATQHVYYHESWWAGNDIGKAIN